MLAEMKTVTAANKLNLNFLHNKEKLRVFIPTYRTLRTGIIKDIPQDLDEDDIVEFLDLL